MGSPGFFSTSVTARLYRTGDQARFLPDGNIEFLGRSDHQIKVRVSASNQVRLRPCSGNEPVKVPGPEGKAVAVRERKPAFRVTVESLRAYGCEALEKAGLPPEGAAIVTEVQLEASLRGQPTHNMGSIPRYARRNASGRTNPQPRFRIERETAVSALVDGDNGQGQW